jgi:serine/threonine-protein kinase RsbW
VGDAATPYPDPAPASAPAIRLTLTPEPKLLSTVRLVVGSAGRRFGLDEEQVQDLKVAVSEACTLAIAALRAADLCEPLEIDLFEGTDRIGVEVRDRAPAWSRRMAVPGELFGDDDFSLALVSSLAADVKVGHRADGLHATTFWLDR